MAFNENRKTRVSEERITADGQKALALNAEHELYTMVATSLLSGDKYYEKGSAQIKRAENLVYMCSPQFVSNLASYARNELNMRSMPMLLTVLLSQQHRGSQQTRKTVSRVLQRADEFGEILGCYANLYGSPKTVSKGAHSIEKKLAGRPNALVRGLRDVFESGRFNAYHYSKYSQDKKDFTIRDAMFLSHPKAQNGDQKNTFAAIANKKLEAADRWETRISGLGKADKATKLQNWVDLLEQKKLPHMALLRNLRNIMECKPDPAVLATFLEALEAGVIHGKQFPFRYWSAYKQICQIEPMIYGRLIQKSLNNCLVTSARNSYTIFNEGQNLVAIDVSGSMSKQISEKSDMSYREIGLVLGCTLAETQQASYGMFGTGWIFCTPSGNPIASIDACNANGGTRCGHGTCPETMVRWLRAADLKPDNVLIFTDMQFNSLGTFQQEWAGFRRGSPKTKLWFVDLTGYGSVPVKIDDDRTFLIAGWNDQVFNVIRALQGGQSAVDLIRGYEG